LYSRQTLTSPRRSHILQAAIGDAQMNGFVSQALALMGMAGSMGGPWKSSVATGVRTTAAVLVPLVIGQLAGDTALALMVGIGGLNVSLADIGGPYRMKAVTMGVATISLAAAAFLGTVVGWSLWLSLPLMFLLASTGGLAGLYGNAAAKVSFLSLILFVLMVGMPAGVTAGAERCMALISGGLWAMTLSLWLWPVHPYQPIREAVAACYRAMSAFIGAACQTRVGGEDAGSGWSESVTQERAMVVEAIAQAHGMIDGIRASRAGMSPTGQELLVLLRSARSIFDAAIALAETLEGPSHRAYYARVRAEVEDAVRQLAAAATELATAIVQGHEGVDLRALDQATAAVGDKLTGQQQVSPTSAQDLAEIFELQSTARALQVVIRHVHAAVDILARVGGLHVTAQHSGVGRQTWRAHLDVVTSRLQDNLTFRSLTFRHALRLGVMATVAVALPTLLNLPHGAWVPLTAMVILKPNFGGTYLQAKQRVVGTVAGSVMGAILAAAITELLALDLLLVLFGIPAFSLIARNYGLGVLFLTPFIVLLLNTVQPGDWEVAAIRSFNTVIGGLLALLAGYLLWPSWERERLPEQLARTIAANRDYFLGVIAGYRGQTSDPAALRSTRTQAQLENANAAAAFQRLLSEPEVQHGPIGPTYALVTYNQRFYDSVTTLAVNLPAVPGQDILPGLETFTKSMEVMLRTLENAVQSGHLPAEFPARDASLNAAQAYIRQLATTGVANAATEQPDRLNDDAIPGIVALRSELDRLADEVVGMSRALNPGNQRHGVLR
jgi:uncharacterized membrane protein YccC